MPTTLSEVAQRAGVSLATASRVLNGSTHGVAEELRARVLAAAKDLRYVPNAHAQALARASNAIIGVIVGDGSDPYFSEVLRGVQKVAGASNRLVMTCNSYYNPDRELEYVRLLHAHRVEALIVAVSGHEDRTVSKPLADHVSAFIASGGHVAMIGRHHMAGNAVIADNIGGGQQVAQAFVERGHRTVGVIGGLPQITSSRDRLKGFCTGLAEYGLELPPALMTVGDFTRESGARAMAELLERAPGISAVFAQNDLMAVGAIRALRERGLRVPEDVSVVGFDDIPLAVDVTPALSTVLVPLVDMGARATQLALDANQHEPRVEQMPTTLVLRETLAARA